VVRTDEVYRNRRPAAVGTGRAVDADDGRPVAVAQGGQLLQQPAGEAHDPGMDGLDAHRTDVVKADADSGDAQVVDGPVLEAGRSRSQVETPAGRFRRSHRIAGDCTAGAPLATYL